MCGTRVLPPNSLGSLLELQYERSLVILCQPVIIHSLLAMHFVPERCTSQGSRNTGPGFLLKVIIQIGVFLTLEGNMGSFMVCLAVTSSCIGDEFFGS